MIFIADCVFWTVILIVACTAGPLAAFVVWLLSWPAAYVAAVVWGTYKAVTEEQKHERDRANTKG